MLESGCKSRRLEKCTVRRKSDIDAVGLRCRLQDGEEILEAIDPPQGAAIYPAQGGGSLDDPGQRAEQLVNVIFHVGSGACHGVRSQVAGQLCIAEIQYADDGKNKRYRYQYKNPAHAGAKWDAQGIA